MAPNSLFGQDDADKPKPDPNEGVRLLDADEVAKAAERAETAKRLGPDEKKYGDRPEAPPADVKPAMRFPLADTADPSDLERPKPAPVTPRTADDPTGSRPVISVGPSTGETQLPHWTEPATGEVPRVIIGEGGEDDDDRWAAFASTPRWRDENRDWDDHGAVVFDDLIDDESTRLGALDESDRMMDEEYLTFDDLEVPDAAPPKAPPRGTASDPIKIQRSGRTPAPAIPLATTRPPRSRPGPTGPVRQGSDAGDRDAPSSGERDRQQAIQVGLAIAGGALIIFVIGIWVRWLPIFLVSAAIVGCLAEFFSATARAGFRPIRELGLVAVAAMPFAAYFGGSPAIPQGESGIVLVLFLTVAASMGWYLFGAGKGRPVANIAITLAGVLYIGVLGSFASLILRAGPWPGGDSPDDQGVRMFILIALGTTMCDVGGYLLGSRIGKTPLSEASPNKTREGLVAGMVASVATVLLFGGVFHLGVDSFASALVLGIVLAVVAPFGDLVESMIKRDLGVKDMGSIIPAHGGLLDRLDAYLFTLPAAYYALRVLGLL